MLSSACLILFLNVLSAKAELREKRLVLHSDTDIVTKVLKMEAEIVSLTASVNTMNASHKTEMSSLNASYNTKIASLNASFVAENAKLHGDINILKDTLTKVTNNDHGSTYTRWGRTVCSGNGSQLVYKGYMAGRLYSGGSGANNLCLPENPTVGKFDDAKQVGDRGNIYGTEYEEAGNVIFGKHVTNQDVPCAVCKTPGLSVMIPARTNCYDGWNLEYTGYLMSDYQGRSSPSNYVCVDADPEFLYRGEGNTDGHLLYLVETICGTLPCPPYVSYRELACSVCSK